MINEEKKFDDNENRLAGLAGALTRPPRCFIRTFGCQQNVSDSERIAGLMMQAGYQITDEQEEANLIIFNTCAVREHAEDRVFGNVGAIKRLKEGNRNLVIALGGCMVQQPHIAEKLRKNYPFVDILFNTNQLSRLPGLVARVLESKGTITDIHALEYAIEEGLPVQRAGESRAFVPIMYGCDNFCSYCVVPLVRGRERSRRPADILAEFRQAVAEGCKDITLLGQNVNSYGKGLEENINFAQLLRLLNDEQGDFLIRFMTSHPKDATPALFDAIADCKKLSRHVHLPVQSGSDDVLRRMNRGYTAAHYLELMAEARAKIKGVTFSSDIIVGFPGETERDFEDTLKLVECAAFSSLFTFIYSKREGTPAAGLPDDTSYAQKVARLARLTALQDGITKRMLAELLGQRQRALVTDRLPGGGFMARLDNNQEIELRGAGTLGEFVDCTISEVNKKRLYGQITEKIR